MSRRPLIAGNWKMHKTPRETEEFIGRFGATATPHDHCDVLLIPSFTSLDRAGRLLEESNIALGAQDMHCETAGAYTGATSPLMLVACGCRYVLVGHSERRHVFGDSNDAVGRKLRVALENGLQPVLCIGELLEQRHAGHTESILEAQLSSGLEGIDDVLLARSVIAYEPVWAIGTGETATPDQAQTACAFIRAWVRARFGEISADAVRILYGGSVNPSNARDLQAQSDIDGALIGGASLDPDSFAKIILAVKGVEKRC